MENALLPMVPKVGLHIRSALVTIMLRPTRGETMRPKRYASAEWTNVWVEPVCTSARS